MYNLFSVLKTMLISKVAGVSTFPSTLFSEIVAYVCNTASLFGGFPGGSDGKESACNVGDPGSIPGLGRSPGEGNGYPLQYSCQRTLWTEEPGGLQSMGSKESDASERF